ncbi:PAS domain-containing sensor histidine kinase [Paenibacillus tarimensis]|uniref:PAS domain-containing sensor histidine kinase n=1 Tax=Paenibacillus tarimensis TaxID=416012 RepID=UPI001F1F0553|nr:PAS domain-containing protein [Paenibacillus tarimensis]MCF2945008.1 PAS domain S-box protein [Paenibacillus tarimensis]
MNRDGGNRGYREVIGENVNYLLAQLDTHIEDAGVREHLHVALRQLADVKFALDESSIVAITDARGIIQYVNDKFCEISQYSRTELLGEDHRIINSGYHDKAFMQELWRTIGRGEVWRGEIKNRSKNGTYYWVDTTIVPFINESGRPYQYLAIRNEVTQLKQAEHELKQMMAKVMHIQEEERKRFSRELHDGIGQSLFSLLIQIDRMIGEHQELSELGMLRSEVSNMMEDIRSLAWEMRPSVLDDLGVVPAIRTYVDTYSQHYGIAIRLSNNLKSRLDVMAETTIYRVIQESLTNIAKYADVSEAEVAVEEKNDEVEVRIVDRGKGFTRSRGGRGVGLFSMEERARGIGGRLTVDSEPGIGTEVKLIVPKR